MRTCRQRLQALFFCGTCLLATPVPGWSEDCPPRQGTEPGVMAVDATLARPVGTVATVTGFALFLISSPFAAMGGNTQESWDSLVGSPARYTFRRPLGQFDCPEEQQTDQ